MIPIRRVSSPASGLDSFRAAIAGKVARRIVQRTRSDPCGTIHDGQRFGTSRPAPRHRVDLSAYTVEWTKVTNRNFAESLNSKGLSLYDDARFHRVAGEWVADASAGQSPVVEATWFGTQEYCPWFDQRLSMEA